MKKEFEKFLNSPWGLELWLGEERIFRSKKSGVKGLLDFVDREGRRVRNLVIFDKIVGRGVALLAVYLGAREVYGVLGSKLAAKALRKYRIRFYFQETISNILNRDQTGICPIEKLSIGKTPEKFFSCFKK